MGSGYNLPDGCYESDLPGWGDKEVEGEFECPNDKCQSEYAFSAEVLIDGGYRNVQEVEVECPTCGHTFTASYDNSVDDGR